MAARCARAGDDQAVIEPATTLMKSRRRIACAKARSTPTVANYIRDLRSAKWGLTINLRCKNPEPPTSALGQKLDIAGVMTDVCFPFQSGH